MAEDKGLGLKRWLSGPKQRRPKVEDIPRQASLDRHRLAVLPFANIGPDVADEYFADGMTEELISTMSRIGGLKIIARTSAMTYKGSGKKIGEIAKELEVGSILEGSVRKAGNRLRINVQLIDSQTSEHLWVETYDKQLEDVLAIQSDIAETVAGALKIQLLARAGAADRRQVNPDAYTLYLKGRSCWHKRDKESLNESVRHFEEATRIDPRFALAYTGLADAYGILAEYGYLPADLAIGRAEAFSEKALRLDPDLAEAHAAKGLVLYEDFKLGEAEQEFRKAIELKPSYASAHQWYFLLLMCKLRFDEALKHIEKAVELDPLSPAINMNHAFFFEAKRDYQKAVEVAKRAAQLNPQHAFTHSFLAEAYGRLKMYDDMRGEAKIFVELIQESYPDGEVRTSMKARMADLEGDKANIRKLLPELEALMAEHQEESYISAAEIAGLYFSLGETDKGFEWLEQSYVKRKLDLSSIMSSESLDGFRQDPRYLNLIERLGLK